MKDLEDQFDDIMKQIAKEDKLAEQKRILDWLKVNDPARLQRICKAQLSR